MTRLHRAATSLPRRSARARRRALWICVAFVSLSVSLSAQGENRPTTARPWPPAKTTDGQPNVEGAWRPASGGTHSLDPPLSSAQEFEQRSTGVVRRNPSIIV